ncbi:hypothetical protein [Mesorhizobium sp. B2-4-6]|nr:hypothetical protein [Mesorhizobium sp. B2-4-6]
MASQHKLWAVFWIGFCLIVAAAQLGLHDGCVAVCINIATAGGN